MRPLCLASLLLLTACGGEGVLPWPDGVPDPLADGDGDGELDGRDCDPEDPAQNHLDADGDGISSCDGDCNDADPTVRPVDSDGDGLSSCAGDCDDTHATVHPGAPSVCDGILDNGCDGPDAHEQDGDGDGHTPCSGDCDDAEPLTWPGAPEVCDGADNDCDGTAKDEDIDGDADGVGPCLGDCDDHDPTIHPSADERCNGLDDDCNGASDFDPAGEVDADQDLFLSCEDCDDGDAGTRPGAPEQCDDIDNDCDGTAADEDIDGDGDGLGPCFGDCDDTNPLVSPELPETCDGIDSDCNGVPDADPAGEVDGDGDGALSCADCDDADGDRFPGRPETCNGIDDDCDGSPDADALQEQDLDGDGVLSCLDCGEGDPAIFPGAPELCDGIDDDCNGLADADASFEVDADGDESRSCEDCDDGDPANTPGGTELCDGADNDCDPTTVHPLGEGDGDADGAPLCADCDDADPSRYPGAAELCNSIDDDCDGVTDNSPPFFVRGRNSGDIEVRTWNGNGFDAADLYNPPGNGTAYSGAVADLDGDGGVDFIAERWLGSNSDSGVHFYSNECDGTFVESTLAGSGFNLPGSADLWSAADLDLDGDADVIGWDWGDGEGWVWLNQGTGLLWTRLPATVGGTRPFELESWSSQANQHFFVHLPPVDVSGDGVPDIVESVNSLAAPTSFNVHRGNGDGTFQTNWAIFAVNRLVNGFAIADWDGDGALELIGGFDDDSDPGQSWIWAMDGANSLWPSGEGAPSLDFVPGTESGTDQPGYGWPFVQDWDGDGDPDLVLSSMDPFAGSQRTLTLALNNGSGVFTTSTIVSGVSHAWGTSDNDEFIQDTLSVPWMP
jgi:hypothetical protein